jgi:tetratricopeptide (TPR) repeat protein
VQLFVKGDKLFKEGGNDTEAKKVFDKALSKYDQHAQAYERRGWTNLRLRNYSDALYDFNKAIYIDDSIAFAHYGKGTILLNEGNYEEALDSFDETVRKSVALQSLHWRGRLKKAECMIELQQWDKAAFELKFFTGRTFDKGDSNIRRRSKAFALYGQVFYELGEYENALASIDKAFQQYTPESKGFNEESALYYKAMAKKQLGKKDYLDDLKIASEKGSAAAKEMLLSLA